MSSATKGLVATGEPSAWIRLPDPAEMQSARQNHPYNFGFVPAMGRLLMAHSRLAPAFIQLYSEIMFSSDSVLTRQEREMVAAATAAAQDCFY